MTGRQIADRVKVQLNCVAILDLSPLWPHHLIADEANNIRGDMHKKKVYRITLVNFEKYNPNIKKSYKSVLVSTGFLSDAKVRQLSPCGKLMLLSFILVAGESGRSQVEVSHESICYQSGVKSGSVQSQLDLLQSLQLLTYEKIDPLNNIKESKVIVGEKKSYDPTALNMSKEKAEFEKLLFDLGLDKNFRGTIPKLIYHFETTKAFKDFLDNIVLSKTVQEILTKEGENSYNAKKYITVALKKETGIMQEVKNENT